MRLTKAYIKNFRSISEVTLEFEPKCRVLVGINESGKTNILKALSLLDPDATIENDDLRQSLPNEPPVTEGIVRFVFTLDKEERVLAYESIANDVIGDTKKQLIIEREGKSLNLAQYFDTKTTTIYQVDLASKNKHWSYWTDSVSKVIKGWRKPKAAATTTIRVDDTRPFRPISEFKIIHVDSLGEIPVNDVEPLTVFDVNRVVGKAINQVVKEKLPSCIYWQYNESNLLPAEVDIATFSSDPDSCLPMRHMFSLSGFSDPQAAINEAQVRTNGLRNLLKRVSDLSTKHMHDVWKDYRGIKLELIQNGDKINAHVEDAYNVYNLARRSDGFKRFITFLLLVSAKAKTKELQNTLYLHDEPDISLHPSGARYLRDELIKIAVDNYVVYSTHSIFMIDRNVINRHLIVEKKNEITTIREVNESNIVDEEVIYNALGYSIFENLKAKNIIFEGWRDKKLFQFAVAKLPSSQRQLKQQLSEIGVCHAKGVKDISRVSPMLELAGRQCVIISDGDKPALEQQKKYDGFGKWLRYDELIPNAGIVTAEDFFKVEAFQPSLKRFRSENAALPELGWESLSDKTGRLKVVERWLLDNGIDVESARMMLNSLKYDLIANLKVNLLEPSYGEFLEKLIVAIPAEK